jgi:hypothetical protein
METYNWQQDITKRLLPPLAAYQGNQFYVLAFTEDILDPAIGNEPHYRD